MPKIDWSQTLKHWKCSQGAKPVKEKKEIDVLIKFCDFVYKNFWDKIDTYNLRTNLEIDTNKLQRNTIFEIATDQLSEHGKIWQTALNKPNQISFELPIAVPNSTELYRSGLKIDEKSRIRRNYPH